MNFHETQISNKREKTKIHVKKHMPSTLRINILMNHSESDYSNDYARELL